MPLDYCVSDMHMDGEVDLALLEYWQWSWDLYRHSAM